MVVEFATEYLIYLYETPLKAIKGKQHHSRQIIEQFKRKVQILLSVTSLRELGKFGGLNLEQLKGEWKGYYSIRLNRQYRLIFEVKKEQTGEITIEIVRITEISKHYE